MRILIAALLTLAAAAAVAPNASAAPPDGPCDHDANPTDDDGVSASCTAAATTCSVHALWFGSWLESPPVAAGCSTELWPPYDCVQDCDGPPDE